VAVKSAAATNSTVGDREKVFAYRLAAGESGREGALANRQPDAFFLIRAPGGPSHDVALVRRL